MLVEVKATEVDPSDDHLPHEVTFSVPRTVTS